MKSIFLFLLLVTGVIFPQAPPFDGFLLSSVHIFPAGNINKVYYTYKIPYNKLVFEKNDNIYSAEYNVGADVFDSAGNFIVRGSGGKKIETGEFEKTNMRFVYTEGIVVLEIPDGHYNLLPVFYDVKTGEEIRPGLVFKPGEAFKPGEVFKPGEEIKSGRIDIKTSESDSSIYLEPIVIDSLVFYCNNKPAAVLTNYEENIPFSEQEYNIIIPVIDTSVSRIFVTITGGSDTVFNDYVSRSDVSEIIFSECDNRIVVNYNHGSSSTNNFIVSGFSSKLPVGDMKIFISDTSKPVADKVFEKKVVWYNKPQSLQNVDFAIKALKYIGEEEAVKTLMDTDSDIRVKALFDYWKKYDPTTGSEFNQLMDEFYQRVDYAALNFSPIAGKNGVETDRGKVLLQFGKPQYIDRTSNEYGKIVETWVYEKPQRKFIFVDQKGTGDFSLTKG